MSLLSLQYVKTLDGVGQYNAMFNRNSQKLVLFISQCRRTTWITSNTTVHDRYASTYRQDCFSLLYHLIKRNPNFWMFVIVENRDRRLYYLSSNTPIGLKHTTGSAMQMGELGGGHSYLFGVSTNGYHHRSCEKKEPRRSQLNSTTAMRRSHAPSQLVGTIIQ